MKLSFKAKVVGCVEAIGGDLLQVTFDSVDLDSEEDRQNPYVLLSQCFEIPGPPTIEWHDGDDYDGGAEIRSVMVRRRAVEITTDRSPVFSIDFSIGDARYKELASFLTSIYPASEIVDPP